MAGGLPAPEVIPRQRLAEAADRVCRSAAELSAWSAGAVDPWQYSPTEGIGALTEVLAARESLQPLERLLVTTGSQQGLDLAAATMLDPGDVLAVSAVSYLGALQAASSYQPRLWAVDSDEFGLRPEALEAGLLAGMRPAAVYVVPNFANPDGATMPLARRVALAGLAERFGFWLVEDDPYGELSFDGTRLPSLRSMTGRTVSLGSASKVLAPGLRVGWAIGAPKVIAAMATVKQGRDLHTSSFSQAVAADVLGDGGFMSGHLERTRRHYGASAAAAVSAWSAVPDATVRQATGGMFHWVDLGLDADRVLAAALDRNVCFVPGSAFLPEDHQVVGTDSTRTGESCEWHTAGTFTTHGRFSFATLNHEQLGEAIGRVAESIDYVRGTGCEAAPIRR